MKTRLLLASALAAATVTAPSMVSAQTPVSAPDYTAEKCYGIAVAGGNDCASAGNNSCGGTAMIDSDPNAWIYVPAGYCDRIVGGSLEPRQA